MYCDVQVISGLIDFADMRDYSLYEKEARESANPVRSSGKRVSGKLFDPSGNYFPKKKTALSGLPKHAPHGIEKNAATEIIRPSVPPYLRQKKPAPFRFRGLRKRPENFISAVSFFLSPSNPLRWASMGTPLKQRVDPDVAPNLTSMGVDFVGGLQVVFRGQRRHLQAEAARGQWLLGVFLTPEHVQFI